MPVTALSIRKTITIVTKYVTELGARFFDGHLRDY